MKTARDAGSPLEEIALSNRLTFDHNSIESVRSAISATKEWIKIVEPGSPRGQKARAHLDSLGETLSILEQMLKIRGATPSGADYVVLEFAVPEDANPADPLDPFGGGAIPDYPAGMREFLARIDAKLKEYGANSRSLEAVVLRANKKLVENALATEFPGKDPEAEAEAAAARIQRRKDIKAESIRAFSDLKSGVSSLSLPRSPESIARDKRLLAPRLGTR